ncbi:MAG: hypothetical protein ABS85_06775 [Sphingobacteriales bacterium SCN 48-20]|uniref:putative type IX secretion system sortase PorU2 n=1 Tax=Terrimonas ferruginea TaxID=249 RepID=UPI00086D17D7|nr:C25 family cysteine peptidase [Terrimonas ferruginea]MBN8783830.1 hypothetical protein [Terrimonas ferruginea]ODT93108.1 MAG: hypothetical protein ABS85_06775 [Sphingobacteriales bacterium SCN 48-20]OJW40869.1 MAG: hypothetical protein BGO56_08580 [Sphingobacteriales bacterium 48-107]
MKRFLLPFLLICCLSASAQVYNNEWIDYSKTYYKFKVGASGLYRISQSALGSIGLQTTPVAHFQLWRNGKEVPLYTSVQTGTLGASDYIEFWGEMNDGKADNPLYRNADFQLSDKWSLQTDTAAYFLTVNTAGNNLRLVPAANNLPTGVSPEPFFMHTTGIYYRSKIGQGYSSPVEHEYTYSSSYDEGEGWVSDDIPRDGTLTFSDNNLAVYTGAGAPDGTVRINAAGNAENPRRLVLKLNGSTVIDQHIDFFSAQKFSATFPVSLISGNSASLVITNATEPVLPPATPLPDRLDIAMMEVNYPRLFNFGGANTSFNFSLPANPSGNYLEITNFVFTGIPVLYDITNGRRYEGNTAVAGTIRFFLQPSSTARELVLMNTAPANIRNITSFQQRNFVNYLLPANQGDFLIITHPNVLTGTGGTQPVEEYKNYRRSAQGGGYVANLYMIDELVDQFAFGIKKHPLSVRNFIRWARANYTRPLKSIFLVGKGVMYNQYRQFESHVDIEKLNLVPTFGQPASDNLMSAAPGNFIPLTPIGRLSAINGDEVALYLTKVKQYEQLYSYTSPTIADKSWMKNVVHVVGASDFNTSNLLRIALNNHANIISDTAYAGNVSSFVKTSADAVQQLNSSRIANLFTEGIGLLTYFGHSSSSTLEFNLDNPMNYNNAGKYPVFNVMGCNAGNFYNFNPARFVTKETLSEKYVLAPERGAIAFLASTHLGIVHYLDVYNTWNYTAMSTTHYGKTLGEIMDQAIARVLNATPAGDFYARFQVEQFTLHGDPAIRFYSSEKPDYAIEDPLVKVSPSFISVAETHFELNAKYVNLGKSINKKMVVEVKRTYPDLTTEIIKRDTLAFTKYADSVLIDVPIVPTRDKGLNKITVTLDADNNIDELYESNNSITKDVYIYEDEARPIYPYQYSIVNQQNIKFSISSANAFAEMRQYNVEMDTTELFNSPAKVARSVSSTGGLIQFDAPMTFTANRVYYWRVSPTPVTGDPVWNTSSFVYIPGPETGFNQSHYFQHEKSNNYNTHLLNDKRQWVYNTTSNNIFTSNGCWATGAVQETAVSVSVNDNLIGANTCWFSSLVFNVLDSATLAPWINVTLDNTSNGGMGLARFGSLSNSCTPSRKINFEWRYDTPERRKLMMNFMKDSVPDGQYVVVRNFTLSPESFPGFPQAWADEWKADENIYGAGNSLYHYLKNAGLSGIDSFYRARPFILIYKKNDPSFTPRWVVGNGVYDVVTLSTELLGRDDNGALSSPPMGPSKAWKTFEWGGYSMETPSDDSVYAHIIGITRSGQEDTLIRNIPRSQQITDISSIDVADYPYLRMYMHTKDTSHLTPYQLDYWRLYYDPVPEGAIAPNIFFTTKDTVDVGEPFRFGIGFKNVSQTQFDSIKVKLSITDRNNIENIIPIPKQKDLLPNDTIKLEVNVATQSLAGKNILFVNFNPDEDQPEQHVFNNFAFRNLYVRPDSLNPLLDVTFDGTHILNRDIVSSKPDILIKLKDEARWMVLNDTSLLNLHIRYPDGSLRRYYFNNADTVRFTPAGQAPNPDNTATVTVQPWLQQDGEYELIVSGKDRSENAAGNIEYRVAFQVINKPMISNMLNYPNPFTTSTAFVFTLTGSEVPQNLRIQVLTITGKVVREITKDELGTLRIGRNITEFKWDGTDQYGDKLANGVYLYRVITNLNGKSLDKYKSSDDNTDKYFNKGYGKMYLMR